MSRLPITPGRPNSHSEAPESLTDDGSGPWTPSLRVLLAAVFSVEALTALVVIAYSNTYLIDIRQAPSAYPAYALAIYGFVKLVTAPAGGWLVDRVGMRTIVVCIWAIEAGGLILIVGTANASGFLAGLALLSTGIAVSWLVLFHALGDARDATRRGSATAYMGLTSAAGTATGVGAAALIGETSHWRLAFAVGFGLATVSSALMARLFVGRPRPGPSEFAPVPQPETVAPVERRTRLIAGAMIFAHFVMVTATIAVFGPFLLRTLDLSLLQAGVLLIPAGFAGAGAMVVVGRRSRHGKRLRELAVLYTLGGATVLAIAGVTDQFLFALLMMPFAVALGGAQPLLNASLLDVSHGAKRASRGSALGWLFFAEGLGSVTGPLLVGAVIALGGVRQGMVALGLAGLSLAAGALVGSKAARL